jgi:hypothetical protein
MGSAPLHYGARNSGELRYMMTSARATPAAPWCLRAASSVFLHHAAAVIPRHRSRSGIVVVEDRRCERPKRGDGQRPPHGLTGAAAASVSPDGRRWTRGQEAISWEAPAEEIPSREWEDESVGRTSNRYFLFMVAVESNYCKLQGQFRNVRTNQTKL